MNDRLNFAVIGCGMLARSQHVPNIARSAKTVLHTCCDISDEALKECREKHGARRVTVDYKAAITDPDVQAICVATHEDFRRPIIELAAEYNKPVYVEKPLANTMDEVFKIQKIVKQAKLPFCIGHNRRSSPAMITGHDIFRKHMTSKNQCRWRYDREKENRPSLTDDGIASMSVRINDDWYSWKSFAFSDAVGEYGPLLFEMTHFTDLCNWFVDAEPDEVVALKHGLLNNGVLIKYKTGELASIIMSGNGTFGYPKELYEVMGNGGIVVVDHMLEVRTAGIEGVSDKLTFPMLADRHPAVGTEGGLSGWLAKKRAACAEAAAANNPLLIFTAEPDKGHARAIDRFVDEILGTGPKVCGIDAAVSATVVAFAAVKSARERRIVKVAEIS
jgi:predicted dehydrogenase